MMKTYKYRLFPTVEQAATLDQWFASVRLVYNSALEQRLTYGRAQGSDFAGRNSSFASARQAREIPFRDQKDGRIGLKSDPDLCWITETPRACFDAALRDLDKAWDNFFKRGAGKPSPRTFDRNNSLTFKVFEKSSKGFHTNILFGKDSVKIPKIGRIAYKKHKKFYGEPRSASLIREDNEYYICLSTLHPDVQIEHEGGAIGVDIGVAIPMVTSDGEVLTKNQNTKSLEERYKKLQCKFARQKNKSSQRRKKTKFELSQMKRKQARIRKAWIHKATTELTKRYSYIAIEDLKTSNMTASAKGDIQNPGKNVKAKAGLNREILNVAPYMMRHMLEYKAEWYGSHVEVVDPKHTSQTCSSCGHVSKGNRTSQSKFKCECCGVEYNADHNAAKNILVKSGISGVVADPRKTPSENHKISATSKSIVSCFQPLSVHNLEVTLTPVEVTFNLWADSN